MAKIGDPCSKCSRAESDGAEFYTRSDTGNRRAECIECVQFRNKNYKKAHYQEYLDYQRAYRYANHEERLAYDKDYFETNREKRLAQNLEWKSKNRELHREQSRKRYRLKSDLIKGQVKAWSKANSVRIRYYNHRRRQLLKNGSWTPREWEFVKAILAYTCPACGRKEPEIELTFDHVIPISKGGDNTIHNCQPLCNTCNSSKGVKSTDYRPFIAR